MDYVYNDFLKRQSFGYLDFQGRDSNLSGFIKNIVIWCFEDEAKSVGFGITWGKMVKYDIIFIFWTKYPFKFNTHTLNVRHLQIHVSPDFFHETQVDC